MALTATNARLVAIVIGTALAGAVAPPAAASPEGTSPPAERLYVNPSTGYVTPAPAADQTVQVNPSTGYASVPEHSPADLGAGARAIEHAVAAEPSSGLDWPSAGIGAAAGAILMLLLVLSLAKTGAVQLKRGPRISVAPGDGRA
jgi:hypothetical protein